MFEKILKWTTEFTENKNLANDTNLQEVTNYLARMTLQYPALIMFTSIIQSIAILGFMAGRESARREMAMQNLLDSVEEK